MKPFRFLLQAALRAALLTALLGSACTPARPPAASAASATPPPPAALTPYNTAAATPSAAVEVLSPPETLPTLPAPTSTPRVHTVRPGEDLGGIAYLYHVTVQALREANPSVDPHAMPVGTQLVIPGAAGQPAPSPAPGAALAEGVRPGPVSCFPAAAGGAWCFTALRNEGPGAVESAAVVIRVSGPQGENPFQQTAYAPLDLLSPGTALGLAAYFPAPFSAQDYRAAADLSAALPLENPAARYRPARIEDLLVEVAPDGLSALVTGTLVIEGDAPAAQARVAVTAYDRNGQVVGVRAWVKADPAARQEFQVRVYAAGGAIASVEAAAQAR